MCVLGEGNGEGVIEFKEALVKHFRVRGNVAIGKVRKRTDRGRWALAHAMADMEFRVGVEVGSLFGDSAELWCSVNPQLKLTCVDPYGNYFGRRRQSEHDAVYQATRERLSKFNVTMVRKTSFDAVGDFQNGSLDFVHIDADHSFDGVIVDLVTWAPKVRKGGLIFLHDYFSLKWKGATQAIDAYVLAHRIYPWYATPDITPTIFWEQT